MSAAVCSRGFWCLTDRPVMDHKQAQQRYLDATGAHLKGGKQ